MDNEIRISCLLSARLALLGAIGKNVLGISIDIPQPGEKLRMTVYYEDSLAEDEIEALEVASLEMFVKLYPMFPDDVVDFVEWKSNLLPPKGEYVFMRFGVGLNWGNSESE